MDEQVQTQTTPEIFALDIGTHSVTGIAGRCVENQFEILAMAQTEYPQRAMRDGQIEDIDQVALAAIKIREELEQSLGSRLSRVYIAAAGRALRTQRASAEIALNPEQPIQAKQIADLEFQAIQKAEEGLRAAQTDGVQQLYYIGHSVVQYTLDDYPLSTLLEHRGSCAKVEIIATFLPGGVVESLYTAMHKAGLVVENLTLEPIAAMNAIIPKELRMLNLALVDIGAGTSDIALSDSGSVAAYAMATVAGDEITESIVQQFLVDFSTAEQMKLALSARVNPIPYQDVLGLEYEVPAEELAEKLQPAAQQLCGEICGQILEANGKAPSAVFLVGGGSKLPGLAQKVAEKLQMEERRVAVGGGMALKKQVISQWDVSGPEFATPVGIALTAMEAMRREGFSVTLNGEEIQLRTKRPSNVMELLMMQGYDRSQLLGRTGNSLTVTVDGEKKVFRGERPVAAEITVNGRPASITTPLNPGDEIQVVPSVQGKDAVVTVEQAVEGPVRQFEILVNQEPVIVGVQVLVNGQSCQLQYILRDLDEISIYRVETLGDLCHELQLQEQQPTVVTVNGQQVPESYLLQPQDIVEWKNAPVQTQALQQEEPKAEQTEPIFKKPVVQITLNGQPMYLARKLDGAPYQFLDLFNYVDIDPKNPKGRHYIARLNGKEASYLEELRDGDIVELRWADTDQ